MVSDLQQGDIWWGEPPDATSRPFLVLTRNEAIPVLRRVTVAPVTRTIRGLASELALGTEDGLQVECVASMDNVLTVSKALLVEQVGALHPKRRHELCSAVRAMLDC